jgi:hypothetical protein
MAAEGDPFGRGLELTIGAGVAAEAWTTVIEEEWLGFAAAVVAAVVVLVASTAVEEA